MESFKDYPILNNFLKYEFLGVFQLSDLLYEFFSGSILGSFLIFKVQSNANSSNLAKDKPDEADVEVEFGFESFEFSFEDEVDQFLAVLAAYDVHKVLVLSLNSAFNLLLTQKYELT
jgi:hypothetical protein